MISLSRVPRLRIVLCLLAMTGFSLPAKAEPKVTANLSQTSISVGDVITLTIEVWDVKQLNPPQALQVEGLEISGAGHQQRTQITNNQVSHSVALTYTVEAKQPGSFVIPRVEIQTDAGLLKTEPLKLTVQAAKPGAKPPLDADGSVAVAFAEIDVPKKNVYVGEAVPVEVRLYVDPRIRWRIEEMPVLEGEGFTKVKFPRPREEKARKDGRELEVLTFRTAISPGKAGKVTLGPMDVSFIASIPRPKRARSRPPFDMFDDGFFSDPFGAFGATERRKVTAAAIDLDVRPLPAAGRPKDFSGAVGQFRMTADATPKRVKLGDPITMKIRISGKGNFDRVSSPTLVDETGWHPYPANADFKANDDLSYSGAKTFEMAVVPEIKKTEMPQVQFSYFDPEAEKYVTLKSEPAPLSVEGGGPPARLSASTETAKASPEPAAPAPPPEKQAVTDILGLNYEPGARRNSFEPLYRSFIFWLAQAVPLLAFIGLLGVRFLRKDDAESRAAALRRERNELWSRLRSESSHAEFFQMAARLVQLEAALSTGRPDASIDALTARSARPIDEETAAGIDEIFSARAELLYAGTARGDGRVSADQRERVLTTLEHFAKSHARK